MHRILIIQDSPSINAMLKFRLEREGFSVDVVETGSGGIERTKIGEYGVILLDYNLPDINGSEVCKVLKKDPCTRRIPILLMSAKDEEKLSLITEEAGADGFVGLPFDGKKFVGRLETLLKAPKSQEIPES